MGGHANNISIYLSAKLADKLRGCLEYVVFQDHSQVCVILILQHNILENIANYTLGTAPSEKCLYINLSRQHFPHFTRKNETISMTGPNHAPSKNEHQRYIL